MLQSPILSGRLGKWAYTLMEYDFKYEPLRAMKGQVLADFIMDHHVEIGGEQCVVRLGSWKLFFDGSVCN
jgi:hypothetical protein